MRRGWHQRPHWRTSKYGRRFPAGRGGRHPYRPPYQPLHRVDRVRSPLERFLRDYGFSLLRSAAVGASCAAAHVACPAITALNKAVKVAQVAKEVRESYQRHRAGTGSEGEVARSEILSTAFSETISRTTGVNENLARIVGARVFHSVAEGASGGMRGWRVSDDR